VLQSLITAHHAKKNERRGTQDGTGQLDTTRRLEACQSFSFLTESSSSSFGARPFLNIFLWSSEVLVSEPLNCGLCCFAHLCKQRDLVEVWSHLSVVSRSFISDSAVMLSMRT